MEHSRFWHFIDKKSYMPAAAALADNLCDDDDDGDVEVDDSDEFEAEGEDAGE